MSDFDLGYFYYLHDKNEEAKELDERGSTLMRTAITIAVFSIVLWVVIRRQEVFILLFLAGLMFVMGKSKEARMKEISRHDSLLVKNSVNVEIHGSSMLAKPFSQEVSLHIKEKEKIASIVLKNSGSDINTIYRLYLNSGGTFDAEHFVKAVHSLKKNGLLKVTKTVSQTSFIPSTST